MELVGSSDRFIGGLRLYSVLTVVAGVVAAAAGFLHRGPGAAGGRMHADDGGTAAVVGTAAAGCSGELQFCCCNCN